MRYSQYIPPIGQYVYFPIWGFKNILSSKVLNTVEPVVSSSLEKSFQKYKKKFGKITHRSIAEINDDETISSSAKEECIFYCAYIDQIETSDLKNFLKSLDINN